MNLKLHLQAVFDDMRECAVQIRDDRTAFFRQFPFLPPTISVGDGRSIYVSKKSVAAIQAIARVIRENSVDFRGALPHKEMVELVSSAIGSIIVVSAPADETEFTIPSDSESFLVILRERLAADLLVLNRELTHVFWRVGDSREHDRVDSYRAGPVFSPGAMGLRCRCCWSLERKPGCSPAPTLAARGHYRFRSRRRHRPFQIKGDRRCGRTVSLGLRGPSVRSHAYPVPTEGTLGGPCSHHIDVISN
jgi:hypothetical protein